MSGAEAIVAAWAEKDRTRAVHPADRELASAAGIRALIVDLVKAGGPHDELFDACAVLGRLFAQRGGSPTLASATLDHLAEVLGARDAAWLVPARAAAAEGFAATAVEDARNDALRAWEYPSCAVPLGHAGVAIAAGHPSDDDEVVSAWAARVAKAAAMAGIRRAVVSGGERASAALLDALTLVGIEVQPAPKVG
ncbi:MAG TPA: hypothetical protein VGG39_25605 [Polyangiaceae bacterium]|jgi:hypothetical protein